MAVPLTNEAAAEHSHTTRGRVGLGTAWSKGLWERVVVEIGRLLVDALFDPRMTAA